MFLGRKLRKWRFAFVVIVTVARDGRTVGAVVDHPHSSWYRYNPFAMCMPCLLVAKLARDGPGGRSRLPSVSKGVCPSIIYFIGPIRTLDFDPGISVRIDKAPCDTSTRCPRGLARRRHGAARARRLVSALNSLPYNRASAVRLRRSLRRVLVERFNPNADSFVDARAGCPPRAECFGRRSKKSPALSASRPLAAHREPRKGL